MFEVRHDTSLHVKSGSTFHGASVEVFFQAFSLLETVIIVFSLLLTVFGICFPTFIQCLGCGNEGWYMEVED